MHTIQCKCGSIRGQVSPAGVSNRVVCYCADCRAFAHFLGNPGEVLDEQGGTEIVQVAQARVSISQGKALLAAIRLTDKGLVRWYASCCKTPIGNTLINPKISFIGLIHSVLDRSKMDTDFGKDVARVNTQSATGDPKPKQKGLFGSILKFIRMVVMERITGRYKKSPLFDAFGNPIAHPVVLTDRHSAP